MTRALSMLIAALAVTALGQDNGGSQTPPQSPKAEWNFDKDEAGKTPGGWRGAIAEFR